MKSLTAGVAALILLASGCGGGGGEQPKGESGSKPGTGTFTVENSEPDALVPGFTTGSYGTKVQNVLFDTLVVIDPKTGQPKMRAAESIDTEDNKTWTIKLKAGQTFHNGDPVTAKSFTEAWNRAAYGPNAASGNYYFDQIDGYADLNPEEEDAKPKAKTLKGLKAVDESTLEVTLAKPFNQFVSMLTFPVFAPIPEKIVTTLDDKAKYKEYNEAPIGNGPYEMDGTWKHDQSIKVKRFEGYKGNRPAQNGGIEFKIYKDRETAYTDLSAGNLDFIETIPPAKVPEAKTTLGERFMQGSESTTDYLGLPVYDKRFQNKDLRKAISMAIDREGIVKAVFNDAYKPMKGLLPELIPGHRADACKVSCDFNAAEAKKLYDAAGGFKGKLILNYSSADPSYEQWMQAVANSLKEHLGIQDIELNKIPQADYFSFIGDQSKLKGPYRQNWYMDFPSPQNYLQSMWGSGNKMGWKNKQFDDLISQANGAKTPQEALPLYQQAEDLALEEMPMIPLWNWQRATGFSDKIDNVTVDAYALNLETITVK